MVDDFAGLSAFFAAPAAFAFVIRVALFSDFVTVTQSPALTFASDATAAPVAVSVVEAPAASFTVMVLAVASVDTTSAFIVEALAAAGALAAGAAGVAAVAG